MIVHHNCTHPPTDEARAACRLEQRLRIVNKLNAPPPTAGQLKNGRKFREYVKKHQ